MARLSFGLPYNLRKAFQETAVAASNPIGNRSGALRRIALMGFMGAGKSVVGRQLAGALGWTFIDVDDEIVRVEGRSIAEIFEADGEARFRQIEHRAMSQALDRDQVVIALGGGAVELDDSRALLASSPDTLVIYLEAPLDVLIARCSRQLEQPDSVRRPVFENTVEIEARYRRRKPLYEGAHWTISTLHSTPQQIAEELARRWNERR
jgi:shikimate kinase